jgi:hypothetical protein
MVLAVMSGGCLSRRRAIPVDERLPASPLTMTRSELIERLEIRSRAIQTLSATATLYASGGAAKSGGTSVTEYHEVGGPFVVRRPNDIRIVGKLPPVGLTAFDMVSNGREYRASIPNKNWFVTGESSTTNPVLGLQPTDILDALFIDVVPFRKDPNVGSSFKEWAQAPRLYYVFEFFKLGGRDAEAVEEIWIDRSNLEVARKIVFGKDGKVEADVQFFRYEPIDGIPFPQIVDVKFPTKDCGLRIEFQKPSLNQELAPNTFELQRPTGAELVDLASDSAVKLPKLCTPVIDASDE